MRKWSREYDKCVECGTTKFRHLAKGQCLRCYQRLRRGLPAIPDEPARVVDVPGKAQYRWCCQCKLYKPAGIGPNGEPSEFYAKRDGSGYVPICILCSRERYERYYRANKEKERARYHKNKAKKKAAQNDAGAD